VGTEKSAEQRSELELKLASNNGAPVVSVRPQAVMKLFA
jgi:hypothetical protein